MASEKNYLRAVIYIKLILVAIMWGGTFIATRMASQVFEPFTGASFRYLFALVFMIPLMLMKDKTALRINKNNSFNYWSWAVPVFLPTVFSFSME